MSAPASSTAPTAAAGSKRSLPSADERLVQPRLGHDESDAPAEPAPTPSSSSSSATSAVHSTSSSPAACLYRHALECILAFSDLKTLAAALRVSKEWLGAVASMGRLAFKCISLPVECAATPAMGRHVADFSVNFVAQNGAGGQGSLARLLPHLRRLRCWVPEGPGAAALFPAGLRELTLVTISFATTAADINAAIVAAGRLEQLESLTLGLKHTVSLSYAPLAALPHLRILVVHGTEGDLPTDEQVDELRALPQLRELVVQMTAPLLQRLLRQPHNLQWQKISLPYPLKPDDAALLPQLPSLTELNLDAEFLTHFDFVQRLPNLASLQVTFGYSDEPLADRLAEALRHCASLVELTLHFCTGLTAAHLADLLPRLPRLQSLSLDYLHIDSLSFLAQPPLTSQLTSLTLSSCKNLPLAELHHVHKLRGLRELDIYQSFNERIDPDCEWLTALRPPSAALPLLESFFLYEDGSSDEELGDEEDEDEDDGEDEEEDEEDEN